MAQRLTDIARKGLWHGVTSQSSYRPTPSLLRRTGLLTVLCCSAIVMLSQNLSACPFCAPQLTFWRQIEDSQGAVAAQWVKSVPPDENGIDSGSTTFKVRTVLRAGKLPVKVDDELTLRYYMEGTPQDLFFVTAHQTGEVTFAWDRAERVSATLVNYIKARPTDEAPVKERMNYFLAHLEHPEETIAIDAYSEFAAVRYDDVAAIAKDLPREKLLQWITDTNPETAPVARKAFYGMLLGLCGTKEDAAAMEQMFSSADGGGIIGRAGIVSGYLLLTGTEGLDKVEQQLILSKDETRADPFAAVEAIRFMWTYGNGRIPSKRLIQSMRLMLDNPGMAEFAVTDLTRWDDFALGEKLFAYYDREGYDNEQMQTAIIRYYLTIGQLNEADYPAVDRPAIVRCRQMIEVLKKRDPVLFDKAERYLRPAFRPASKPE
ncbi:MAG: hypothetical protein R3C01_09940 [Planctomycetaceae bacterium]